jgi:hypothetical protein
MREINNYNQPNVPGGTAKLPTPVEFDEGQGCPRVRFEARVTAKNTNAVATDYTFARAKMAAASIFGFISNWFGNKAQDRFDNAITLAQLRELVIATTDDDVMINGKFWGDYADADVLQAAVAQNGLVPLVIEVPRTFEITQLGRDANLWVPGWSQMRQLHSEIKKAGDFDTDAKFVQEGAAEFILLADTCELHDDNWANVVRLYVTNEIGKLNHAPAGELMLAAVWERSKTAAQTMVGGVGILGLFSLKRAGEPSIHENVQASRVARSAKYAMLPGGEDLGRYVTPLHFLPQNCDPNDIPTGAGWIVEMPGAEIVGGANVAYAYLPVYDEGFAESLVKPNVVGTEQGDRSRAKLVNVLAKNGRGITSKLAAFAPRAIVEENDAGFATLPGDLLDVRLGKVVADVPESVLAAAKSHASGASSDAEKDGRAVAASKGIAKFLTGGVSSRRRTVSAKLAELRARIR